jgi:predicted nucleic acid-binding protein
MYCLDTDVLPAVLRPAPFIPLVRRLAMTPPHEQFTTSITLGELLLGARRKGSLALERRIRELVPTGGAVLPFDRAAAEVYAAVRTDLERSGRPLAEPDLRIAAIALSRDLTLVTGNVRPSRASRTCASRTGFTPEPDRRGRATGGVWG